MIVVQFTDGIGNQLYQYAVYYYLQKRYPDTEIKADISDFKIKNVHGYGFGLKDFFGIELDYASNSDSKKVNYKYQVAPTFRKYCSRFVVKYVGTTIPKKILSTITPKYKELQKSYITNTPFNAYNGNIKYLDTSKDYYLSGYWQNYEYVRPIETELREKLTINVEVSDYSRDLLREIDVCNSVCIHIRRGDYISPEFKSSRDICGVGYYERAIREIESKIGNPHFYVFSDDIQYCKEFLSELQSVTFVSGHKGVSTQEELLLISRCHSAIIPNSTFSFWGVWMTDHPEKIVIAPKYAVRGENCWHRFTAPEHWTIIDNLDEE